MRTTLKFLPGSPMLGWTHESIKAYFEERPPTIGQHLVLASWQGGFPEYRLVTVTGVDIGRQKRIAVSLPAPHGNNLFYRSGKNCFAPKSRGALLPMTEILSPYLISDGDVLHVSSRDFSI